MSKGKCGKSGYKFFYFITVRDNEGNARKYVYNLFRSIVKKYNAKYYGVLSENPYPHVHAVIITDEYVNYADVWRLLPNGVHFDAQFLNSKDLDDLKRILHYIETHCGFLSVLRASIGISLLRNSLVTYHGHPTSCRVANRIRGCWA